METIINKKPLIIDECDGTETLFNNRMMFKRFCISVGCVNSSSFLKKNTYKDFDSLLEEGNYEKELPTKEVGVHVHKGPEGYRGEFRNVFSSIPENLDSLCLNQGQIVNFCKKHKDQISPDGTTLFVFKLVEMVHKVPVRNNILNASNLVPNITYVLALVEGSLDKITIEPFECELPASCDHDTDINLVIPAELVH